MPEQMLPSLPLAITEGVELALKGTPVGCRAAFDIPMAVVSQVPRHRTGEGSISLMVSAALRENKRHTDQLNIMIQEQGLDQNVRVTFTVPPAMSLSIPEIVGEHVSSILAMYPGGVDVSFCLEYSLFSCREPVSVDSVLLMTETALQSRSYQHKDIGMRGVSNSNGMTISFIVPARNKIELDIPLTAAGRAEIIDGFDVLLEQFLEADRIRTEKLTALLTFMRGKH